MDERWFACLLPTVVEDDRTRLADRSRDNLVTVAGQPLPCAGDHAHLVAIVPDPVAMPVTTHDDVWDWLLGPRTGVGQVPKGNAVGGCLKVGPSRSPDVVREVVQNSIDPQVERIPRMLPGRGIL